MSALQNDPAEPVAEGLPTRRQFLQRVAAALAVALVDVPALAIEPSRPSKMSDAELEEFFNLFRQLDKEGRRLIVQLVEAFTDLNNARSPRERRAAHARVTEAKRRIEAKS